MLGRIPFPIPRTPHPVPQVLYGIQLPEHPQFLPDISVVDDSPEPHCSSLDISHGPASSLERALSTGLLPHRR